LSPTQVVGNVGLPICIAGLGSPAYECKWCFRRSGTLARHLRPCSVASGATPDAVTRRQV